MAESCAKALTSWQERYYWLCSHLNAGVWLKIHSSNWKSSLRLQSYNPYFFADCLSPLKQLPTLISMLHIPSSKPTMENLSPFESLSCFKILYPGKSLLL